MAILFDKSDISLPKLQKRKLKKWISLVANSFEKRVGEIAYVFCSDQKILEVNNQYLKHNYYTDIITFDYTENSVISGDIFISINTVKSNSVKFKTEFADELHRVIIHGILHLCGLKDKNTKDAEKMREEENIALKLLENLE
ncbi:MAG: rRNA maturation RNase YbeY [Dysgonamonadaceae bacterium]|jgi:rRNA maturation RNase YbeY|nr:rRNA maturation RNase YbeY [Dysgonamonadaceae bacterium]